MADWGIIGMNGSLTKRSPNAGNPAVQSTNLAWNGCKTKASPDAANRAKRLSSIVAGTQRYVWGSEDFSQGNPTQPSLRMDAKGLWRFRWALAVGSHVISVNVLHAINQNPRPSIVVKANPAIGIPADIETFAPSGTGWVTISSQTFTTTVLGVTWVELRNNLETNVGAASCYWDHIVKT